MNPDGFGEFIVTAEPANQLALEGIYTSHQSGWRNFIAV